MKQLLMPLMAIVLVGCQSAYYSAAEQMGYHKRDILVDRVEDSRDAQQDAQEQFESALAQLAELVNFDGGDLQEMYEALEGEYEESAEAAAEVSERIDAVDDVANALFEEWQEEITLYSNARLKSDSQAKLRQTRQRYDQMIAAMRASEARMDPVLDAMRDFERCEADRFERLERVMNERETQVATLRRMRDLLSATIDDLDSDGEPPKVSDASRHATERTPFEGLDPAEANPGGSEAFSVESIIRAAEGLSRS